MSDYKTQTTIESYLVHFATTNGLDVDSLSHWNIAEDLSTPEHILRLLSECEDSGTKCFVAKNPNTPSDILENLSRSEYRWVKREVAKNPNSRTNTLESLMYDSDDLVRHFATQAHMKKTYEFMDKYDGTNAQLLDNPFQ